MLLFQQCFQLVQILHNIMLQVHHPVQDLPRRDGLLLFVNRLLVTIDRQIIFAIATNLSHGDAKRLGGAIGEFFLIVGFPLFRLFQQVRQVVGLHRLAFVIEGKIVRLNIMEKNRIGFATLGED